MLVNPNHVPATQDPVLIVKYPVDEDKKYILFVLEAEEAVLPHVPLETPAPPRYNTFAVCEVNEPKSATTPLPIVKLLLIVVPAANVFVPLPPDNVKL